MSSYRESPNEFDASAAQATPTPTDVAAAIEADERRMQVRAYNYWVSLLDGRDFPSIEDLEPAEVEDFAGQSVLLDFTGGRDNPAIPYVGAAVRDECGMNDDARTIFDVPGRSLLSRLTDHYMQIVANRAPVGFEAEFENQREESICYRGILMPFSSDGDTIDFIYGVINWKQVGTSVLLTGAPVAEQPATLEIAGIEDRLGASFPEEKEPLDLTEALRPTAEIEQVPVQDSAPVHFSWEDGPLADSEGIPFVEPEANTDLTDRLWVARETAELVKTGEGRTRAALYRALSLAYDFSVAAAQNPNGYAELLEQSGVKAQARAPMTPIVKLVFGTDYDKTRLTEFAAALSCAERQNLAVGSFEDFIDKEPGGLKALVAAERQVRRPVTKGDSKSEVARARLRSVPSISLTDLPIDEEFALVVTRRRAGPHPQFLGASFLHDGSHASGPALGRVN